MSKKALANVLLICAAIIWGTNFAVQKTVAADIGPFSFLAMRAFLGSLTLFIMIVFMSRGKKKEAILTSYDGGLKGREYVKSLAVWSLPLGIINIGGCVLIQMGLLYTTASKAGFIGAIYIVIVPVIGYFFFKEKSLNFLTISGILLAAAGLYNLCMDESLSVNKGDLIILASTMCFSVHIHLIDKCIKNLNGIHVTCMEFFFASVFCAAIGFFVETTTVEQIIDCLPNLLYSGIMAIGVCYCLQVTAQKYTEPTIAALLMSLEACFSALAGVVFLGESFTLKEITGVIMIFTAVIIAQIPPRRMKQFNKN